MTELRHIGLGLGRLRLWHDGLGEFSRQLGHALAVQAPKLRAEQGVALHFHLPSRWHGVFGPEVGYLGTHTTQRWCHLRARRFALWHNLHQHNRLRAPLGVQHRLETVHDLNFLHTKSAAKVERYRARLRHHLAQCEAAVAITHYVANDIVTELAPLHTPVRVIHNGATDLTMAARKAVPEAEQCAFLLHVSRMAPSKNILALLDLAAAWPEMRLLLVGATSSYTDTVRQWVSERELTNVRIRLDIEEAEKAWLYAHCEGFLFPSLAEGFGLPPIEAMYFGKPVFLSRRTSLPEIGGDLAFYFDEFDGQAMRAVVEHGLSAHSVPDRSDAVRRHALGFSWQRCASQYLALYLELIGPQR